MPNGGASITDPLKAHLLFDMYRSLGGLSCAERGDLVTLLDGNVWIYGDKDSKLRKSILNLVYRWKQYAQEAFQKVLVHLGLTLLPLLAPRGCAELSFALSELSELSERHIIVTHDVSSCSSSDASCAVVSISKSFQPAMKFGPEVAKKAVEENVDTRNVGVKPKSIDEVQKNLEIYVYNEDGVVAILPTIYVTKAHMPLGDYKIVKVLKRESIEGELQFQGWTIFKPGCIVSIVDMKNDDKLYTARIQPDKHTVWIYLPASNGMETIRDQTEGNVEDSTQDALDATHGLQASKNQKYVVQPIWFPDELSVRFIKEEKYDDTLLPAIPIPLRVGSETNPNVYLDVVQIEWNAVIANSGKQLGERRVRTENQIYTDLAARLSILDTSVASTNTSTAAGAVARAPGVPTNISTAAGGGVPTNISTVPDDASTTTAVRRSRRISNRGHAADISVIGEDMELT